MLDFLTAKLISLGYEWDTDDTHPNEAAVAESEMDLLLEQSHFTDPDFDAREDDRRSESSEDFEDTDSWSDCTSDSTEDSEGDDTKTEYVFLSTCCTKALSSKGAIQVSVREISEFE